MAERYGEDFAGATQAAVLGETTAINGVDVTFHPAGHVLGSAQIAVEKGGMRIVASGDYKRRARSDLPELRAGHLRCLHHRGDLRAAGLPPSRRPRRDPQAPRLGRAVSRAHASRRRLRARQGAARHRADPRGGLSTSRSTSTARCSSSATSTSRGGHRPRPARAGHARQGPEARFRRHDRRRPALRLRRPLGAPLRRPGRLLRLRLDAHPPARPAARRRAAARHLRPLPTGTSSATRSARSRRRRCG